MTQLSWNCGFGSDKVQRWFTCTVICIEHLYLHEPTFPPSLTVVPYVRRLSSDRLVDVESRTSDRYDHCFPSLVT